MSFRDYIAKRRITDTPAGDFVADAKRDPGLPDAETWDELEAHLLAGNAASEAVEAGRGVWRDDQASLKGA